MSVFRGISKFLFITCDINREKEVLEKIREHDGVKKVYKLSGVYNAVVEIDDLNYKDVLDLVKKTPHVYTMTTCFVVNPPKEKIFNSSI